MAVDLDEAQPPVPIDETLGPSLHERLQVGRGVGVGTHDLDVCRVIDKVFFENAVEQLSPNAVGSVQGRHTNVADEEAAGQVGVHQPSAKTRRVQGRPVWGLRRDGYDRVSPLKGIRGEVALPRPLTQLRREARVSYGRSAARRVPDVRAHGLLELLAGERRKVDESHLYRLVVAHV